MEINIKINDKDTNFAGLVAKQYENISEQKKVYLSTLGICALENYLKNCNIDINKSNSLFRIKNILKKTDIFDLNYNGKTIDIRTFANADALYVPKKHFTNNILPQYYVLAIYDGQTKGIKLKGCITTQNIDKTKQTKDYYVVSTEQLAPIETLVLDLSQLPKQNNDYNLDEMTGIFAALTDGTLDEGSELKIINYMYNLDNFRCKFTDFVQFEELAQNTAKYPDLFEQNATIGNDLYIKDFIKAGLSEYMPLKKEDENNADSDKFAENQFDAENSENQKQNEQDDDTVEQLLEELEADDNNDNNSQNVSASGIVGASVTAAGAIAQGVIAAGSIAAETSEAAVLGAAEIANAAIETTETIADTVNTLGDILTDENESKYALIESDEDENLIAETNSDSSELLQEGNDLEFLDEDENQNFVAENTDNSEYEEQINEDNIEIFEDEPEIINEESEVQASIENNTVDDIEFLDEDNEENTNEFLQKTFDDNLPDIEETEDNIELIDEFDEDLIIEEDSDNADISDISAQDKIFEDDILTESDNTEENYTEETDDLDEINENEDNLFEEVENSDNEIEAEFIDTLDETHYPAPEVEEALLADDEPDIAEDNDFENIELDNSIEDNETQDVSQDILQNISQNVAHNVALMKEEPQIDEVEAQIEAQMEEELSTENIEQAFEEPVFANSDEEEQVQNEYDYSNLNSLLDELETISEQQNINTEETVRNVANASKINNVAMASSQNVAMPSNSEPEYLQAEDDAQPQNSENIKTLFDEDAQAEDKLDMDQGGYGQYMQEADSSRKKRNFIMPILAFCIISMGACGSYWAINHTTYGKNLKTFFTKSQNVASTAQMKSIDEFDDETFLAKDSLSKLDDTLVEENSLAPNPDGMGANDLNQSISNIFDDTLYPVTISKIAWEVPDSYLSSASFKKYLNIAGVQLQRELQTNLAKVNDISPSGKLKLSFRIYADNSIKDMKVLETSGVDDIDKISKKCIVDTLTYIKIPVIPSSENFVTLTLSIIF